MASASVTGTEKGTGYQKLSVLGSLVPARVIKFHLDKKGEDELVPFSEEYEAAVLFADISGFSNLAEKLAKDLNCSANAAENLSSYIGSSLELMVQAVCSKGGDVIKFAGDAILAIFSTDKFHNSLEEATKACVQVSLDLLGLNLTAGGVQLSIHCGVGAGKVVSYHVGGLFDRWEYVITGDPVDQIGSAEPEANAGEVVIAEAAYNIIKSSCEGTSLESGNFRIDRLKEKMELLDYPLIYSEFPSLLEELPELWRMQKILRCYVPGPVLQAVDSGQSLWFSELRPCSTLFCKIKRLQFNSTHTLELIQRAVRTVQQMVYLYEGTLCRFIVDDKGAGLLLAFGLPPYMHENDPVRATKSALEIHQSLLKLKNNDGEPLSCAIGVTSGRVFCGTTGGKIRCEYTLHGTLVNLAARYMSAAKDGVLCGEATFKESRQFVNFEKPVMIKVKGKEEPVPVYRPTEARDLNSFDASIENEHMVGRKAEKEAIEQSLNLLTTKNQHQETILVTGEAGIGKSLLLQDAFRSTSRLDLNVVIGIGVDTEKSTPLFVFKSILSQLVPIFYKHVVCVKFQRWLQNKIEKEASSKGDNTTAKLDISNMGKAGGLSPFSPAGSQVKLQIHTKDLTEQFFTELEKLCVKTKGQKDDQSSEQLLQYMGYIDTTKGTPAVGGKASDPASGSTPLEPVAAATNETSVPNGTNSASVSTGAGPTHTGNNNGVSAHLMLHDAPDFSKLTQNLLLSILMEMIPNDKGNLKEMYPLLEGLLPKIVTIKDNDTTENMKKELRAESLLLLVKEVVLKTIEQLEAMREYDEEVSKQQRKYSKALSTLGIEEHGPTSRNPPRAQGGGGGGRKGQPSKSSNTYNRGSVGTDHRLESKSSSSALSGVTEDSPSDLSTESNPGSSFYAMSVPGKNSQTSYRMRVGQTEPLKNRVVLIIENLQWVDPMSLRLLQMICKEVDPISILLSSRFQSIEGIDSINELGSNLTHLHLGNLSREEIREGMRKWLGDVKEIPDKALSAVMEKSGGHPLFAAELAKLMVTEKMIIIEQKSCKLSKKAQEGNFGLPDTISALMTSKLDRLPPSQQLVIKVAAVIGKEFQKHELLALMPKSDNEDENEEDEQKTLSEDILQLVQAGLLHRDPNMIFHYHFTNAMLRESAYNLLLFQKRKDLHRTLAKFHEDRNKEYLEPVYFLLATNYYLAEDFEKAVYYSEMAGDDSLDRHGMKQVLICFSRLLEIDSKHPETTKHIPLVRKVGWNRKVGEALLHLGKTNDSKEYFHAALKQIDLFQPHDMSETNGCFGQLFKKKQKPHLVKDLAAFRELEDKKDVHLMLEAANIFELLGKTNCDRTSAAALEYRLNALDLAHVADHCARQLEPGPETEEIVEATAAALARSNAYSAVFHVCTGKVLVDAEPQEQILKAGKLVESSVKDSETSALVHFKVSEFACMIGDLKRASDGVRKAIWVCNFLMYERLAIECQLLSVAIFTFMGLLGKANKMLKQAVDKMPVAAPNYFILASAARMTIFVGNFELAENYLERIGRLEPGTFDKDFDKAYNKILRTKLPETLLALSLLVVRKYNKNDLAIAAAIRGTELLQSSDLSALPLVRFHTAAFLLTAFAECLAGLPLKKKRSNNKDRSEARRSHRLSFSQVVVPVEDLQQTQSKQTSKQIRANATKYLKSVMGLLKEYAKTYDPCKPHVTYTFALYKKILNGKSDIKLFLKAEKESETFHASYVRALALFEAGLVNSEHLHNAKLAFWDCIEGKNPSEAIPPDAPYELQLLTQ